MSFERLFVYLEDPSLQKEKSSSLWIVLSAISRKCFRQLLDCWTAKVWLTFHIGSIKELFVSVHNLGDLLIV